MKNAYVFVVCALLFSGCSGQFWGGAATGAVGAASAYELTGQKQLQDLKKERDEGKISQEEYDIRRKQIESGHLIK
jgi:hypothetical protein